MFRLIIFSIVLFIPRKQQILNQSFTLFALKKKKTLSNRSLISTFYENIFNSVKRIWYAIFTVVPLAQAAGAVEYTDYIPAEG